LEFFFPVVVGLGNPGERYSGTRHNFGFEVLDLWAEELGVPWEKCRFANALAARRDGGWLVKPQGYMNLSGMAVRDFLDWFRYGATHVMIVVDDVNLPLGVLRMRAKGSDGGHNGLKSVARVLGTEAYARLRGGVGAERHPGARVGHVLGRFTSDERVKTDRMEKCAVRILKLCGERGMEEGLREMSLLGT
jgi:PTH1 family peptidyl-tRNA hydrolase